MGISNSGKVLVFVKPAGGWVNNTESAILTASDAAMEDRLGWSVGIDGDVIVSGAEGANAGGKSDSGTAYVFVRPTGGWVSVTETAKLTSAVKGVEYYFGHTVSISGNVIVVGADGVDAGAIQEVGAAYVFLKPVSGWVTKNENYLLYASDKAAHDTFAYSVAVSGHTLVAGATARDSGGVVNSGATYVFATPYEFYMPMIIQP